MGQQQQMFSLSSEKNENWPLDNQPWYQKIEHMLINQMT